MTHHDGRARQELTTPKKFICILVVASVVLLIGTAHDMNRDSLFYHASVADKISVALCLVGEARQSTFQHFNGLPPVSAKVAGLV